MRKKILVIDDDATDVKKITEVFEAAGHEVTGVSSIDEAMNKAQRALPDLVVVDVVMPDTTGFDVCRKIKATFQPHPPRVLMITGKAAAVNVPLAHRMGADGFEAKTTDMAHVLKAAQDIFLHSNN